MRETKKLYLFAIAITSILFLLGGCGTGESGGQASEVKNKSSEVVDDDVNTKNMNSESGSEDVKEEEIKELEVGIGEQATINSVSFTLNTIGSLEGVDTGETIVKPTEQNSKFIASSVTIENKGNDPISIDPGSIKFLDGNGVEHSPITDSSVVSAIGTEGNIFSSEIKSGSQLRGSVVFEANKDLDITEGNIFVQLDYWGENIAEVTLSK
ncbi:DUF4352 domain-containing protein [Paraliobacillus ryukyuensis]|uniref:DUF4352 domain-containing protein n=1 Tax=Paraliobacillus ryukyuensis TaxID=200904 RepID=UPI0015C4B6EB|nr:DUF4352 domain-containing protein [Paraliobacillus ryukyuensis]